MVNIIEECEDFAKYAHDKVGFYQILGADKNIEVRVSAGKAGFKRIAPLPKEVRNTVETARMLPKIVEY